MKNLSIHNPIQELLTVLFGDPKQFRPTKHFYRKTGIRQKRWGILYRGDQSPTLQECAAIAAYFSCKISVLTDKRQLRLFNND
jgi:hypothetical protein